MSDEVLSGTLPDVIAGRVDSLFLHHSVDRILYGTENEFLK